MTLGLRKLEPVDPLRQALKRVRGALVLIGGFSFVINTLMLSGSLFMMQVYDRVLTSRSVPTLLALFGVIVVLFAFQGILEAVRSRMISRIARVVDEETSIPAFKATVSLPIIAGAAGEKVEPMRDLDTLRVFVGSPAPSAFFDLPWMPLYLAIVYLFHPLLGYLAIFGALIVVAVTLIGDLRSRSAAKDAAQLATRRQAMLDGARRNAEVLSTMNLATRVQGLFQNVNNRFLTVQESASDTNSAASAAVRALRMLLQSAVLGLAAYLAIRQEISAGGIIAASIITARALAPVEMAIAHWRPFLAAREARRRLKKALVSTELPQPETELPAPHRYVMVDDLYVGPPGTRDVTLQAVRFKLEAGDGLGLIGPSGSGKTTLARALVGAWPVLRGNVTLDGAPLHQYSAEARGRGIGYLPQDVELFDGTIADNIARFDPERSDEAIVAAAKLADVHELVLTFPQGYDTIIGDGGAKLSAGQRQRIGLARALYGDPFLLVLDEPYSNLDGEGEAALSRAVAEVRKRDGIVVLIAHRQSAIRVLNKLLVITNGRQSDFGMKDDVLKRLQGGGGATPGGAAQAPPRPQPAPRPAAAAQPGHLRPVVQPAESPAAADSAAQPQLTVVRNAP
jgi:ATP-binding cassette subfamily C protein